MSRERGMVERRPQKNRTIYMGIRTLCLNEKILRKSW